MKICNQRPQKPLSNNFQVNLINFKDLDINPSHTLRVLAFNFGFGLVLKSKDQMSTSDGSNTSLFSSTIFQKLTKTLFIVVATLLFLENMMWWCSAPEMSSETSGPMQGCVIVKQTKYQTINLQSERDYGEE